MKCNKKGFTLVEIMIVVAVIALLAAIAIPNLLRAKTAANESAAMARLKALSTASETYTMSNNGSYPSDETSLGITTPPYVNKSLCGMTEAGWNVSCQMNATGYTFTAVTSQGRYCNIVTGGVLTCGTFTIVAPPYPLF